MKSASLDARNTAAPATSSVVPHRLSAVSSRILRSISGSVSAIMSVLIHPGQIALTVMCGPSASASALVRPFMPAFDTTYSVNFIADG